MDEFDDTTLCDLVAWEDEIVRWELEQGLCPWVFADSARVEL
jgi:hypothetical protein